MSEYEGIFAYHQQQYRAALAFLQEPGSDEGKRVRARCLYMVDDFEGAWKEATSTLNEYSAEDVYRSGYHMYILNFGNVDIQIS